MESIVAADRALFVLINSTFSHPWLDVFFPMITDLHKTWFIAVFAGFLFWSFWRVYGKRGLALFGLLLVTAAASDVIASKGFKANIERPRPAHVQGLRVIQRAPTAGMRGFPSNHAANMFAIATFTAFFLPGVAPALFAIALLVGYSRIYCGAHFPTDVLAGALLGIVVGVLVAKIAKITLAPRPGKTT